jgi:hypothetical protein
MTGWSGENPKGPGFNWGDYPKLRIRFDPSVQSANHITAVSNAVSSVKDQTGNGMHCVQANAAKQPTSATISTGKFGLQGNAVSFLQTAAYTDVDPKTIVVVAQASGGASAAERNFSGAANGRVGVLANGNRFIRAGSQLECGAHDGDTLQIWLAECNGAASALHINGGAAVGSGNAGTSTDTAVTLLALASGTNPTNGIVGDYARFGRVLTVAEKNEIGTALATKHGLTWTTIT